MIHENWGGKTSFGRPASKNIDFFVLFLYHIGKKSWQQVTKILASDLKKNNTGKKLCRFSTRQVNGRFPPHPRYQGQFYGERVFSGKRGGGVDFFLTNKGGEDFFHKKGANIFLIKRGTRRFFRQIFLKSRYRHRYPVNFDLSSQ